MQAKPISIVHLVASLGKGGAEKQLYLLATHANPDFRHSVLAVCHEGPWVDPLRAAGVEVNCLNAPRVASLAVLTGTIGLLRRTRPDVVHCWLPSMNLLGTVAVWLGSLRQTGLIASVRNVDNWKPAWRRRLDALASHRWNAVICNSWAGRTQALKEGIREEKLSVIGNGIPKPAKLWTRAEARCKLGIDSNAFVAACASRLVAQKRVSLVLEAARQLPTVEFVIAGEGPLFDILRQEAPANVRMLGMLDDPSVLFAAADVFLSVAEREGTSNSLLEALQAGCAALVTDAGDNLRVAGPAGVQVTPTNLAKTIRSLEGDPSRLAQLRAAAPHQAAAYSVGAMVQSTERVYRAVAGTAPSPSKRILYLDYTNGIGMGGGQRSLLLLLAHLDRGKFEPVLACPPDETWRRLAPADVRVFDLPLPAAFRKLSRFSAGWALTLTGAFSALGSAWRIRRLTSNEQIEVVHANNFKMLLIASIGNWGRRIPILWHVRDILPERRLARWTHRIGTRLATRVIAVSEAVARQFSCSTDLVHNAVRLPDLATAAAARASFRRFHAIPQDAFAFGYVGRIDPGKGIDVLLRAFARASVHWPGIWLVVAGEGANRGELAALANQLHIERITWTGFEESPGRAFAAMDCVVVPSVEPDSFPRAVIEAMSWSLPVIGTSSGGIAEAIIDGQTGSVVPIGDAASLAGEMVFLAGDPELARLRGEAGRRLCEQRFAVARQMRQIEELYQEVLQETR